MAASTTQPASGPQIDFIHRLLRERNTDRLTEVQRNWLESEPDFTRYSRNGASRIIDGLMKLPMNEAVVNITEHGVANGRYAVTEADGVLRFFRVNTPEEGRWRGRTFVDVMASDERHPIKDPKRRTAILALIAVDPKAAMLRYGQEIGSCGHCGRTLTNELSRQIGIGPICRGKMGW